MEALLRANRPVRREVAYRLHDQLDGAAVTCEWVLMERCLHNLIQNAYKYAQASVCVTLALTDGNYLVAVEDDGIGIAPQDARRVFDSFVRLRSSEKDNKSGFGLGLAIVRRIATWHGGEVHVTRSELGGARFVLQWPAHGAQ